jgi:hypothetical protein
MSLPTPEHFARSQFTTLLTADTRKATDAVTAVALTAPSEGSYYLHSTVAAFFIMGLAPVTDPAADTGVPIAAGAMVGPLWFDATCNTVEVINSAGAGVASLIKVS